MFLVFKTLKLLRVAMLTSAPILSADFPHAYGGRPRKIFSDLRFGATLTFKLIAGF